MVVWEVEWEVVTITFFAVRNFITVRNIDSTFPYQRVQVLRAKTGLIINSPGTTHLLPVCLRLAIFFCSKRFGHLLPAPVLTAVLPLQMLRPVFVTSMLAGFCYKFVGRFLLSACWPVFVISMLAGFLNCSGTGSVLPWVSWFYTLWTLFRSYIYGRFSQFWTCWPSFAPPPACSVTFTGSKFLVLRFNYTPFLVQILKRSLLKHVFRFYVILPFVFLL